MKTAVKHERNAARPAWRFRRLFAVAAGSTLGIAYCLAAQQDEKNGFPFTAALEWRKAAGLLAPIPLISERCWREWERIMQLPRDLAAPISDSAEFVLQYPPTPSTYAVAHTAVNEFPLAAAA